MDTRHAFAELGLTPGATAHEVKAAWRRLVSHWHPDRNSSAGAVARMQRINDAFRIIHRAGQSATPEPAPRAGPLMLGVRPEHVVISDEGAYRGRIEAVEYLGTTQIITLSSAHGAIKARTPSDRPARVGDSVGLGFTPSTLALFDAGTGRAFRTAANAGVFHG